MRRRAGWVALACVATTSVGCNAILGLDEKSLAADGGTTAHQEGDAAKDAPASTRCTPDDAGYNDLQNPSCWATFPVPTGLDSDPAYSGGAFDGRYVYFPSNAGGPVVRYDTTSDFASSSSWTSFDTSEVTNIASDLTLVYAGAVFDGHFLYLVPGNPGMSFVRYDTTLPFDVRASWTAFDLPATTPLDYEGGTFDGRYVYFTPFDDAADDSVGLVARYDTKGAFTAAGSWSSFDMSGLSPSATTMYGAVFDGRYVYFGPGTGQVDENGAVTNVAARYDTKSGSPFGAAASWESFDMTTLASLDEIDGFQGAIYDGTYVYFVPDDASADVVRFDPTKSFTAASSWSTYAPEPNLGGVGMASTPTFAVGAFDGMHLYMVPAASDGVLVVGQGAPSPFASAASWSSFTGSGIQSGGFGAAVFDGQFLYLAPGDSAIVSAFARFDAKQTRAQPVLPDYFGSFF